MKKADNHIHSKYSFDSKLHIYDLVVQARKKKLDYITLTDHVEFATQPINEVLHRIENRDKKIDEIEKNTGMRILKGLEISEPHLYTNEIMQLNKELDIDVILGSIHHILGMPMRKMAHLQDIYNIYLRNVLDMVETADIDAVAHLDYIKRFIENGNFDEILLNEILKIMIERGIALEVNTSGYRRCGEPFPNLAIVDVYEHLGGSKITLGSDAHELAEVADGFDEVSEELASTGLKQGIIIKRRFKNL